MTVSPIEVRTRDPLEKLTRKERRNLLAVSAAAIVVVKTGLIPTKVSGLGIEFGPIERSALFQVLAGVVLYFLVAFLIYSISDWLSGRWSLQLALQAQADEIAARVREDLERRMGSDAEKVVSDIMKTLRADVEQHFQISTNWLLKTTTPIVAIRWAFEFAIPLGIAVYALIELARAW